MEKKKINLEKLPDIVEDNFDEIVKGNGLHQPTAVREARFPRVYEMILYEKLPPREARSKCMEEFAISERAAEYLLVEARERLKERFALQSEEIITDQLARMFDLLKRCRKDGNKKVERELLADLNKIYGLEQRKLDITSNGEPITINISIED
jgi:hypothetical protein